MSFSKTIQRIIDEKTDRLETIPDAFANRMIQIQRAKLSDILSLLDELEYSQGAIVINEANLLKVEGIVDRIRDTLTDDEFEDALGSLMTEFDKQAEINYKYFDEALTGFEVPTIARSILRERKIAAVESLLNSTEQFLTNPMRQALSNAVVSGSTRSDLIDTFTELVLGTPDSDGRLLRATRQIVSDTFALSDASVTDAIAQNLGLEYYLYTGGKIDTTRCFCLERNAKYYHKKEVQAWGRLEGIGKCRTKNGWAGMMPDTNEKTIFITRGGYNCQHAILPVSEAVVPQSVIKRNA